MRSEKRGDERRGIKGGDERGVERTRRSGARRGETIREEASQGEKKRDGMRRVSQTEIFSYQQCNESVRDNAMSPDGD